MEIKLTNKEICQAIENYARDKFKFSTTAVTIHQRPETFEDLNYIDTTASLHGRKIHNWEDHIDN